MFFTTLLLIGIAWLLWTIHLDLVENNDRQRGLRTSINELLSKLDKQSGLVGALETTAAESAASVNLNTASKAKLQTLPRIGAVGAEHIIAARPFADVDSLRLIQGITDSIFQELKEKVCV